MLLTVKVVPSSKKAEIVKLGEGMYKIKVDAVADKGKANLRLIEILSKHFNVNRSGIRIVKGLSSRDKLVEVLR
ncbi:MAG: DUF167 domain-containing protein [Candidatus Aenigmarchaeota archaeon]|nr:DUF167 domain-containing protein [Candidatus Aenigmarchaeota archaeon]